MSQFSPQKQKLLAQAAKKAQLTEQNKAAAQQHLLRMQALLTRMSTK